ncbi:MAG: outer membrane lipoprotein carrier protein LolA [Planctomycetota bacterium]
MTQTPRSYRYVAPFAVLLCGALTVSGCASPAPAAAESETPAPAVKITPDAPPPPAEDSETAEAWLDRLEASAAKTRTLKARARLTSRVDLLDDETVRFGDLVYAGRDGEAPARFAVHFDRLKMDGQTDPVDQAYVFDGRWLLDLNGDDRVATRRELVAEGEQADLNVGEGPFPLPLDLNKARVMSRFDVALLPAADDDPKPKQSTDAGSFHLRLIPHDGVEIEAEQIDLWFDRQTLLPLRAVTLQEDGDTTTLDLFNNTADAELRPGTFDTSLPIDGNWETQIVPLD